jgi:uncharacterized protein (DUF302 family)
MPDAVPPTQPPASFGIRRVLDRKYEDVLARTSAALQAEGFGILTEVDVRDTLKKKLGVEFRRYKILGACNPPLAHRALETDLEVGLMMPCNVVVYEEPDGRAVVCAVDPLQTMAARGNPALREVASAVRARLERAIGNLT